MDEDEVRRRAGEREKRALARAEEARDRVRIVQERVDEAEEPAVAEAQQHELKRHKEAVRIHEEAAERQARHSRGLG